MNPRLAHLITRLYPPAWRERYGAEFEALLQAGRGDLRTLANVLWSALCERIVPAQEPGMDQGWFRSWCVRAPWAVFGLGPLSSRRSLFPRLFVFVVWLENLFAGRRYAVRRWPARSNLWDREYLFSGRQVLLFCRTGARRLGNRAHGRPAQSSRQCGPLPVYS